MADGLQIYRGPHAEDLACFPEALHAYDQWILFQLLEVPDKHGALKLTKVPINYRDLTTYADVGDRTIWDTLARCMAELPHVLEVWDAKPPRRYKKKPATYKGVGIGFVFTAADPFTFVDMDHSVDPTTLAIAPWARDITTVLQSYTQRSISGTGLHTLLEGQLPPGAPMQYGDLQMWDHGRFVAMTGWHVDGTPATIEARQSQLTMVHAAHILMPKAEETAAKARKAPARPAPPRPTTAGGPPLLGDQEILDLASRAANNAKFLRLWSGDHTGYDTESEADEALLSVLAFYTRDPSQLDRLFRQSDLCDPKWENRPGYRDVSIANALDIVTTSYDPQAWLDAQIAAKAHRNGQHKASLPPASDAPPPTAPPWTLPSFLASLEAQGRTERQQAVVDAMDHLAALSTTEWMVAKSAIKKLAPDVNLNDLQRARKELILAAQRQAHAEAFQALPDWQQALFYAEGDQLQETDNNLQAIFAHHDYWQEQFSWDVVAGRGYINAEQPLDIHYVRNEVTPWLGRVMRMPVRHSQRVLEVMRSWAQRFPYDPIQDWLAALPAQDDEDLTRELLDTWLITHAGAADTPYTKFVSRLLPVSLVKRAQEPGCQYRYVVVLEGEEDLGKTKLLRVLGDRWHQEFPKTVEGKEAYMQLQGYWLVELGELDALKPAQETRIKMFISQQMDVWIPKYENDVVEQPRRAVLVGTTNEREYLKGEHGNTRYLPIFLPGPINHGAIADVRDRLFTQAKHFLADHAEDWWCIPEDVAALLTVARTMRKEPSVFEEPVRTLVLGEQECTIAEILGRLEIPPDRWTKRLEMEIGAALTDLGWRRHVEWDGETHKTVRSWKASPQVVRDEPCIHEHLDETGRCNDCKCMP
jgi:predicted P-loop ATPase